MKGQKKHHICMIVQDPAVHGGIAAVTAGYYGSRLEKDFRITYVESYCDGSKGKKLRKALAAYRIFRNVLRKDPPELVHIHASFGPSFYREIPFIEMAVKKGIPVINHIHGSAFQEFYEDASPRKKAMVQKEYGKCARLIVLSDHWKDVMSQVVPVERIRVIPNYSKVYREVCSPEIMNRRFRKKQILYLGVITEGKGMREMAEIIRKTVKAVPDVKFVLAGAGDVSLVTGPLEKAGIYPGPAGSTLFFPGWVKDEEKNRLLEESMLFLLPSHMEAMPMSILEAMGYGLPVVSTDVGGIPSLVENGKTGILCPVGDSDALAAALICYLNDPDGWGETSRQTVERAEDQFGFDKHLDRLKAVYREVLAEWHGLR